MKKVYNIEALLDRLSLLALTMPNLQMVNNSGGVMFSADLIKKDNPNWRLRFWSQEYGYDGTVQVSVTYPDAQGTWVDPKYKNSIRLSLEKDVSKIWADIEKRLLPNYDTYLAEVVENEEKSRLFKEKQTNLKNELVERGYVYDFYNKHNDTYLNKEYTLNNSGKVTVSGENIEITLGYVKKEDAIKPLDFIKELKGSK